MRGFPGRNDVQERKADLIRLPADAAVRFCDDLTEFRPARIRRAGGIQKKSPAFGRALFSVIETRRRLPVSYGDIKLRII
jgi:hypothetical protein